MVRRASLPFITFRTMSRTAASTPRTRSAWEGSDVDAEHIEFLRHRRKLSSTEFVAACILESDNSPAPRASKVVVFSEHFARGFRLPTSNFFFRFLTHFGLQPHHLS
ncbi:hypothetical protein D1007_34031 [Hordeum vulgare]|nr:hypothetical protein D1007_34031 [Hordeum vulgare]